MSSMERNKDFKRFVEQEDKLIAKWNKPLRSYSNLLMEKFIKKHKKIFAGKLELQSVI